MHTVKVFTIIVAGVSLASVFIEIPFVSNYSYWVMTAAFVMAFCTA